MDFTAATRRSIRGWKIAYSPDFDVFPMDRRVTDVVGRAVKAFADAGAQVEEVKIGIKRPQKELSDLWCRLIMPLNVQTFEIFKRAGLDLLKDHRDDFPPAVPALDRCRIPDVGAGLFQGSGDPLGDL